PRQYRGRRAGEMKLGDESRPWKIEIVRRHDVAAQFATKHVRVLQRAVRVLELDVDRRGVGAPTANEKHPKRVPIDAVHKPGRNHETAEGPRISGRRARETEVH